jgi:murein DD-endopeptidase MepM/ murein hydrolase activator NlpD
MIKGFWKMVGVVTLLVAGGGAWFFFTVGEWDAPKIAAEGNPAVIGRQKILTVAFSDAGRGLRHLSLAVTQDNQPRTLSSLDLPDAGVRQKALSVNVDTAVLKLHDGPATLTLTAVDYSLWKNRTVVQWPVTIDLMPPQIVPLNPTHHISPGGSCFVAYRLSKAVVRTGVKVGDLFYPGLPVTLGGKPTYATYFALPMDATQDIKITLFAQDQAGNETLSAIPTLILKKKYRSDSMNLTDTFLGQKMPEFQAAIPELRGKSPIDTFTYVNTRLRADNLASIQSVCQNTEPRQLWEGPFLRMKNAAPMALFGDHRTYLYGGKPVGESIHGGVDLASLVQASIEAANNGIVRFTGGMGIYGNSVIIDHGLGLATLYSHMSIIQVQPGQAVKKGDILGKSGMTGLAAGDHLHFGVAVHGQFVDPKEWWDPHWIEDNVTKKMTAAF